MSQSQRERMVRVTEAYKTRCMNLRVSLLCDARVCLLIAERGGRWIMEGDMIVCKLSGSARNSYVRRFHKRCYEAMRY